MDKHKRNVEKRTQTWMRKIQQYINGLHLSKLENVSPPQFFKLISIDIKLSFIMLGNHLWLLYDRDFVNERLALLD